MLLLPGAHECRTGGGGRCAGQQGGVLCGCGWLNAAVAVCHPEHTQPARSCGLAVNLDRSMERHGSVVIPSDMVGETEGWRGKKKKKGDNALQRVISDTVTQTLKGTLLHAISASQDN